MAQWLKTKSATVLNHANICFVKSCKYLFLSNHANSRFFQIMQIFVFVKSGKYLFLPNHANICFCQIMQILVFVVTTNCHTHEINRSTVLIVKHTSERFYNLISFQFFQPNTVFKILQAANIFV